MFKNYSNYCHVKTKITPLGLETQTNFSKNKKKWVLILYHLHGENLRIVKNICIYFSFLIPHCLSDIQCVRAYDKVKIMSTAAQILFHTISKLRELTLTAESHVKEKDIRSTRLKESLNHKDQNNIGTLPIAR